MKRLLLLLPLVVSCGREAPAPLGEVRLVVDTDLPASLGLHLRADVFANDGRWLDARDVARPSSSDWPASFSVFLPDDATSAREVRVRLRVYPEGEVRDYLDAPRLVAGATPTTEPAPTIAVDRLVRVIVKPGVRARADVLVAGECAGVPSDLDALTTCLEGGAEAAPLTATEEADLDAVGATRSGTFGKSDAPTPVRAEQVGVEGGAFVLGGRQLSNTDLSTSSLALGSTPTRLFVVSAMLVDPYEYTVARFRKLIARGFDAPTMPLENLDPNDYSDCSWSAQPADRESYPLTCVDVATARAACRFDGGDLPTEAEWEYIAGAWGRERKTRFPWGAFAPTCDGVTFGRYPTTSGTSNTECLQGGARAGARAVTDAPGDVTANLSGPPVFGLGGGVGEWTRDSYAPYTDACWVNAARHDPSCEKAAPAPFAVRGGGYDNGVADLLVVFRHPVTGAMGFRDIGFRCVTRP